MSLNLKPEPQSSSTQLSTRQEREFPGAHIGPEPTTDRFIAVMYGPTERVTPGEFCPSEGVARPLQLTTLSFFIRQGNALAVQEDKPFRGLSQFGTAFLQRLECSQCPCPLLESVTFIDTPGVLSGEKQRIGRAYDFTQVVEWFAQKSGQSYKGERSGRKARHDFIFFSSRPRPDHPALRRAQIGH